MGLADDRARDELEGPNCKRYQAPARDARKRKARGQTNGDSAPQSNGEAQSVGRPVVKIVKGEIAETVARCNDILATHSPAMFVLGDVLATLEKIDCELQTIRATPTRIRLELSRVAHFLHRQTTPDGEPKWAPCDPPMTIATAIAEEPGGWRVPVLAGLSEVPILRPNGDVVTKPGYDAVSRIYLHEGPYAPVPDDPHEALKLLLDAISEFPFVDPHHRSAALALLLTAVIRRQLPGAPMFGISAREAGTGKGTLAQLAAILASGRRAAETAWSDLAEEQRKLITSALLRGQPTLLLDNITTTLDSAPLCVLMTAATWGDRLLGVSRPISLPTNVLVIASGNNLRVVGDLCRRVLPIEMDAGVEFPELRRFDRRLIDWAIRERHQLVAAAIGILAAYRKAGESLPDDFAPLGSYEEWSHAVCGPLMWLGEADPRGGMHATRAADPKRVLLGRVLTGMRERLGSSWQTAGSIFDSARLHPPGDDLRDAVDEITDRARDDKAARIMLGRWLEGERGRVVGGLCLQPNRDEHRKVNQWRAEPVE